MEPRSRHFLSSEYPDTPACDALFHVIPVPGRIRSHTWRDSHGPEAIEEQSAEVWDGTGMPGRPASRHIRPLTVWWQGNRLFENPGNSHASLVPTPLGAIPV